jgi:hypothetical protein
MPAQSIGESIGAIGQSNGESIGDSTIILRLDFEPGTPLQKQTSTFLILILSQRLEYVQREKDTAQGSQKILRTVPVITPSSIGKVQWYALQSTARVKSPSIDHRYLFVWDYVPPALVYLEIKCRVVQENFQHYRRYCCVSWVLVSKTPFSKSWRASSTLTLVAGRKRQRRFVNVSTRTDYYDSSRISGTNDGASTRHL